MLRGLAFAILVLNLALLLWGSSRPKSELPAVGIQNPASTGDLPGLVLIDETQPDPVVSTPAVVPCLLLGPMSAVAADALEAGLTAWNLTWQRRDEADGIVFAVEPGSDSVWPEQGLWALAEKLETEILPCPGEDAIAPGPLKP